MSGHSKWSTIKRKKGKTDQQRAKIFTKVGREISVCVREGGPDPNANGKLRDLIAKAKSLNVPNENIERIIKKSAGGDDKNSYEDIVYEGYGPSGVAVIVEALTDNRNRTAGDLRHYFDKFGGNLGQTGSVSFQFERKGIIQLGDEGLNEEKLFEDMLECGGEDLDEDEGLYTVMTEWSALQNVRDALEERGYHIASAEVAYIPQTSVTLTDEEQVKKMSLLLEHLEDNDDVQNVFHNWDMPDEEE